MTSRRLKHTDVIRALLSKRPMKFYPLLAALERRFRTVIGRHKLRSHLGMMPDVRATGRGDDRIFELVK